jgi:hypothetical protein
MIENPKMMKILLRRALRMMVHKTLKFGDIEIMKIKPIDDPALNWYAWNPK